jgi:hypothetical protein
MSNSQFNPEDTLYKPSYYFNSFIAPREGDKYFDHYMNYLISSRSAKYGADIVGNYIKKASQEQVTAINGLGKAMGMGMNVLSEQMFAVEKTIGRGMDIIAVRLNEVNQELGFLNRTLDILNEQQRISNLLLQNIAELLRVPNSEKERQRSIELGLKFFVNAQKDKDLFDDALTELLKAESLMPQDYFVLHRIGCIYMYVEKHLNPEKALEYFTRAAKYASVESDPDAIRLINVLAPKVNAVGYEQLNEQEEDNYESEKDEFEEDEDNYDESDYEEEPKANDYDSNLQIAAYSLAGDSYEKAAFSAYVICNFENAVSYQLKALKYNATPQNRFVLAKYQVRDKQIDEAVANLNQAIDEMPALALAAFKEIDLIDEPKILQLLKDKNADIDGKIDSLIADWSNINSTKSNKLVADLNALKQKLYNDKVSQYNKLLALADKLKSSQKDIKSEIAHLLKELPTTIFVSLTPEKVADLIQKLEAAQTEPYELMKKHYEEVKSLYDEDKLQIGSKFEGGIVFYLDETGKRGLVCTENDLGKAIWGANTIVGTTNAFKEDGIKLRRAQINEWEKGGVEVGIIGIGQRDGMKNTKKIVEDASWYIQPAFFGDKKTPAPTAARLCYECNTNGYHDWYLPTYKELYLITKNLRHNNSINLKNPYWSSEEEARNSERATLMSWFNREENVWNAEIQKKSESWYVIAVREFIIPEKKQKKFNKKEHKETCHADASKLNDQKVNTKGDNKANVKSDSIVILTIKNPETGKTIEIYENDFDTTLGWEEAHTKCKELGEGWRLPTLIELDAIYEELHEKGKGNFKRLDYWSSDDFDDEDTAWTFNFKNGTNGINDTEDTKKSNKYYVRAVREAKLDELEFFD